MKSLIPIALGAATLCLTLTPSAKAEDLLPGQIDFGSFSPSKGRGEFVEVNVPSNLISLAARFVQKQDPDAAQLLNGLKLVRVNVIGLDDDNRDELRKRVQKIRADLAGKGWERIVTAQEKNQDVGIYLKMTDKSAIQGLAAVVMDGDKEAVFVNVVGEIKPEQLAALGEKLNIDPLKNFGHAQDKAAEKTPEKTSEKAEESK
jgi:hypothetical protein